MLSLISGGSTEGPQAIGSGSSQGQAPSKADQTLPWFRLPTIGPAHSSPTSQDSRPPLFSFPLIGAPAESLDRTARTSELGPTTSETAGIFGSWASGTPEAAKPLALPCTTSQDEDLARKLQAEMEEELAHRVQQLASLGVDTADDEKLAIALQAMLDAEAKHEESVAFAQRLQQEEEDEELARRLQQEGGIYGGSYESNQTRQDATLARRLEQEGAAFGSQRGVSRRMDQAAEDEALARRLEQEDEALARRIQGLGDAPQRGIGRGIGQWQPRRFSNSPSTGRFDVV